MSAGSNLSTDAVRDFDLRSRGAVSVVEQWKADHEDVRAVWGIEDLISEYNALFLQGRQLLASYQQTGQFPHSPIRFSHFSEMIERFVRAAVEVDTLVATVESHEYNVQGAADFRAHIAFFQHVLEEDRFATDAFLTDNSDWS